MTRNEVSSPPSPLLPIDISIRSSVDGSIGSCESFVKEMFTVGTPVDLFGRRLQSPPGCLDEDTAAITIQRFIRDKQTCHPLKMRLAMKIRVRDLQITKRDELELRSEYATKIQTAWWRYQACACLKVVKMSGEHLPLMEIPPFMNLSLSAPTQMADVGESQWLTRPYSSQVGVYTPYKVSEFLNDKGLRRKYRKQLRLQSIKAPPGTQKIKNKLIQEVRECRANAILEECKKKIEERTPTPACSGSIKYYERGGTRVGKRKLLQSAFEKAVEIPKESKTHQTPRRVKLKSALAAGLHPLVYKSTTRALGSKSFFPTTNLDFSDTSIKLEDLPSLCYSITITETLRELNLGDSSLNPWCAKKLSEALHQNTSIEEVNLQKCRISQKWREILEQAVSFKSEGMSQLSLGDSLRTSSPTSTLDDAARVIAIAVDATRMFVKSEYNIRSKLVFFEERCRKSLNQARNYLTKAFRLCKKLENSEAKKLQIITTVAAEEELSRPNVVGNWIKASLAVQGECEYLRRLWIKDIEATGRSRIRHVSHPLWQTATQKHKQRLASEANSRAALEVRERVVRTELVSSMLEEKAEIRSLISESVISIRKLILEKLSKDDDERRRLKQKLLEEERDRNWKLDCIKHEQRRVQQEHTQQRYRLISQEDKIRKSYEGRQGKESQVRHVMELISTCCKELATIRDKAGNAYRQYCGILKQPPILKNVTSSTYRLPGIFFINSSDFESVDNSLQISCEMSPEWFIALGQSERLFQQLRLSLSSVHESTSRQLSVLCAQAQEKIENCKMTFNWHRSMLQQVKNLLPENDPLMKIKFEPVSEIVKKKYQMWGGDITFYMPDPDGEFSSAHDNLQIKSKFVTLVSKETNPSSSTLLTVLPKDGSADFTDVMEVISSLRYRNTGHNNNKKKLSKVGKTSPPPFERKVAIDLRILVRADSNLGQNPKRFVSLQLLVETSMVLQSCYLRVNGNPDFEYVEASDEKSLITCQLIVENPVSVHKHNGKVSISRVQSNFKDSHLTIEISDYTQDDQIYLKRTSDVIFMDGNKILIHDVVVGVVVFGTLRRHHPPQSAYYKVSSSQRHFQELFPEDFSSKVCGSIQKIILTAAAKSEQVQTLLESLKFCNLSADPREGIRTVKIRISETERNHSSSISIAIQVRGEDDPTTVLIPEKRLMYRGVASYDMPETFLKKLTPNSRAIMPGAIVQDVDTKYYSGGYLRISISGGLKSGDRLFIRPDSQILNEDTLTYPSTIFAPTLKSLESEVGIYNYHSILDAENNSQIEHQQKQSRYSIARILNDADPRTKNGIQCFQLPFLGCDGKVQIWYQNDVIGVATFIPNGSLDPDASTVAKKLQTLVSKVTTERGLSSGCGEIIINFSQLPHGLSSIEAVQALLRSICFGSNLCCPKEGVRYIDVELLVGNTVKRTRVDGVNGIHIIPECPNTVIRDRFNIRVTSGLLRVPPKHSEFTYVEGSGSRRIAPFEVVMDEEGFVDNYNGGSISVEITDGLTDDDVLCVKDGIEPDSIRFIARQYHNQQDDDLQCYTFGINRESEESTPRVGFADVEHMALDTDSDCPEEMIGLSLLRSCEDEMNIEPDKEPEEIHEEGIFQIAKELLEKKQADVIEEAAITKSDFIEIQRMDGVIGTISISSGSLKATFNSSPPVKRKDVLQVLRNITYLNNSNNPLILKKIFKFSLSDGSSSTTTSAFVSADLLAVNNPTEVLLYRDRWKYRQLAGHPSVILAPLGLAALSDPDTGNFCKGQLSVEAIAGCGKNDTLEFLSPEQQLDQISNYNKNASDSGRPKLYPPIMFYNKNSSTIHRSSLTGPLIARISFPKSSVMTCLKDLLVIFESTAGIITLIEVCAVMQCVAYTNTTLCTPPDRSSQGPRWFRIRVCDGENKECGKQSVAVDFSLPLIQVPGMVVIQTMVENDIPLYVVPKGLVNLPDKQHLSDGFLEIKLVGKYSNTDSVGLNLQKLTSFSVKDGSLFLNNEFLAKINCSSTHYRLEFGTLSKGSDRKRLQELLRQFFYCKQSVPSTDDNHTVSGVVSEHSSDLYSDQLDDNVIAIISSSDGNIDQSSLVEVNVIKVILKPPGEPKMLVKKAKKRVEMINAIRAAV